MNMCKSSKRFAMRILACFIMIVALCISQDTVNVTATKTLDKQSPTSPQSLISKSVSQTSVSLEWSPSVDNKEVASYQIYENATYIASSTSTSYELSVLTAAKQYSISVKAKDSSGNTSLPSKILKVTTSSLPTPSQAATASLAPASVPSPSTKIIAGYYASWSAYSGYTPLNIKASKLTTINYAFANIGSDLKIALGDPGIDLTNFKNLNQLKKSYPNLKTIISIGGWEWSGKFSNVALTDSSRTVFADSVVAFIKQHGFNGVDIDWEYPVDGGLSSNVNRPEDKTNFTLLLQKLRQKLNAQGALDGKKYILSIAGGTDSAYTSNTQLSLIRNYIDYAILMTYDIHGPWDQYTDFNAPLYNPTESSPQDKSSVDTSVKRWISKGFPASKIVLGVPFYGDIYKGVTTSSNGLYKSFASGSSIAYDKIASTYLNDSSYKKYTHADAMVPWLFNGSVMISYDNAQSIAEKAKYAKQKNLGGVSAWELSQNRNGVLLNALYANIK